MLLCILKAVVYKVNFDFMQQKKQCVGDVVKSVMEIRKSLIRIIVIVLSGEVQKKLKEMCRNFSIMNCRCRKMADIGKSLY